MGKYCFGVDLGGTTVKIGLFDTEGTVLDKWEIPTRKEDSGSKILPDIAQAVLGKIAERQIAKEDVTGVGIGVPGPVDDNGVVHMAVNLGWGIINVNEVLGGVLQLPVRAGNDANVAALGEMWCGGGKGCSDMVLATLGTGVGGGIIVNGKMVTGATGAGGEAMGVRNSMHPRQALRVLPTGSLRRRHRTACSGRRRKEGRSARRLFLTQ